MFARLLIALVRVYRRTLSPFLGNVCRFEPSCSRYAVACLEAHGALRGSLLRIDIYRKRYGRRQSCSPAETRHTSKDVDAQSRRRFEYAR